MSDPPHPDDEPLLEPEAMLAAHQLAARRRVRVLLVALAAFSAFTVASTTLGDRVAAFSRGEIDWRGRRRFEPVEPIDARTLASIDMRQVHERLLPAWVIAEAHSATPEGQALARRAYAQLRTEVAPDGNLTALLDSLHESVIHADLLGERTRIDWLVWAYDEYLDRVRIPYRVEAGLRDPRRGVLFWSRSYRVVADVRSWAGSAPARTRLLARVDATNVLDPYLGHSSVYEDGAIVVLDRVLHFAVLEVWPLLDPSRDAQLRGRGRGFAPAVRAEAERSLALADLARLRSTAVDVMRLVRIIDTMHARRSCGSRFVMRALPWNGLTPLSRGVLERALVRGVGSGCPDATLDEVRSIAEVSERLGHTAGLVDAVEALVAWITRGLALHELVHVAEVEQGERQEPRCTGCPAEMGTVERDELRAYLASFADEGTGAVALLQACGLAGHPQGANEQAFSYAAQRLLGSRGVRACELGPPADLHMRAATEARRLFGALPHVEPALPARVPFLAQR